MHLTVPTLLEFGRSGTSASWSCWEGVSLVHRAGGSGPSSLVQPVLLLPWAGHLVPVACQPVERSPAGFFQLTSWGPKAPVRWGLFLYLGQIAAVLRMWLVLSQACVRAGVHISRM